MSHPKAARNERTGITLILILRTCLRILLIRLYFARCFSKDTASSASTIERGRIERGEISTQQRTRRDSKYIHAERSSDGRGREGWGGRSRFRSLPLHSEKEVSKRKHLEKRGVLYPCRHSSSRRRTATRTYNYRMCRWQYYWLSNVWHTIPSPSLHRSSHVGISSRTVGGAF